MLFSEKRLIWEKPPESDPTKPESDVETGVDPDKDRDEESAITSPEDDAQKKAEAQAASEKESAEAGKEAEVLASSTEQQVTAETGNTPPITGAEEEKSDIYQILKKNVGEVWATIIAAIASIMGLGKFFTKEKDPKKAAIDKQIEETKTKYQAVITELIAGNKIPSKIIVRDADPGLLTEYNIKTPEELRVFFKDKTPTPITNETSIVDYVEMIGKPAATTPAAQEGIDPDRDLDTDTDTATLDSPFEKKPEVPTDLLKTPCRIKLRTDEEIIIFGEKITIGNKNFKIEVKKSLFYPEIRFNFITPTTDGFKINIGLADGGYEQDVDLKTSDVEKLTRSLYSKKESSTFTYEVPHGDKMETFRFTAV